MNALCRKMMIGGSTVALMAAAPLAGAWAQTPAPGDLESVVVSASRIAVAGYEQPTPVTVVGAQDIQANAYVDIGDTIRQLPSMGTAVSPDNGGNAGLASQGTAGLSELNVRNLGNTRTLVLFDGQRVVPSDPLGNSADLNTIPQGIIQRVDVVTGGASAAWGSDAVGGVVNLIINKNYTGLKGDAEVGQNSHNNHFQFKSSLTMGEDYLGNRLHVEFSGVYLIAPDAGWTRYLPGANHPITLFPGPAGGPTWVHTTKPLFTSQFAQGGRIVTGTLKNIEFVGTGIPVPYNPGTTFGGNCYDCSPSDLGSQTGLTGVPHHATTLFGFANYKINDNLGASIQLNYGEFGEENISTNLNKAETILSGNPFIPASIQAQMTATKTASISVATDNQQGCDLNNTSIAAYGQCMSGDGFNLLRRQLFRGVFTLNGSLGKDWSWTAYAQAGTVRASEHEPDDPLLSRRALALDAVTVTSANVGTSGLTIGSIACRSTLTAPTNGCLPLNIIGDNKVPSAVLDYIEPGRLDPWGIQDQSHWIMNQNVFSASMTGVLPWGLSAGPIAAAFGAEYHLSQQRQIADPQQLGDQSAWNNGNFTHWAGQYSVEEGFGEVTVPVIKDGFVDSLDINAAGRVTNYSNSGLVETWKIGTTSQINDDFKLRGLVSVDIRAPDLFELYTPEQFSHNTQLDFKTGLRVSTFTSVKGNPDLVPEVANTQSVGVIMTPSFIPGLSASVDLYRISVHGAIFRQGAATVLQQCALGVALFCKDVGFGLPQFSPDYPGALDYITSQAENANSEQTSGMDFQADYNMDFLGGRMGYRVQGNYMDKYTRTALGQTFDGAGALGADAPYSVDVKFHLNATASYNIGPWSVSLQGRYIGPARLNNYWVEGKDVDRNAIHGVAYLDLRTSYKLNDRFQVYGTINNFFDTPGPNIASSTGGSGTNAQVYQTLGRIYLGGIRFDM